MYCPSSSHYFLNVIIPCGLLLGSLWEICHRSPPLCVVIFISGDGLATFTHLSPLPNLSLCTVIAKGVRQVPWCGKCPRSGGRKCSLDCGLFLGLSHDLGESSLSYDFSFLSCGMSTAEHLHCPFTGDAEVTVAPETVSCEVTWSGGLLQPLCGQGSLAL